MSQAEDLLNSLEETETSNSSVHEHPVIDVDPHFTIDPSTRQITNNSGKPNLLMQGDHNSTRYTFELPRYIEDHDMSLCNVVKLHYINIGSNSNETHDDVVDMEDFSIDPENENVVICSWLISRNATQYAGNLSILLQYQCVNEDGSVPYEWNTDIYSDITIRKRMNNSVQIVAEYSDILEQWRLKIIEALSSGGGTSTGGGLPEGGTPNQVLVTNSSGETVWEDKPFYSKETERVIYSSTNVIPTYAFDNGVSQYIEEVNYDCMLEDGKAYTVVIDGIEYTATATVNSDNVGTFGANSVYDINEDVPYQVTICYDSEFGVWVIEIYLLTEVNTEHVVEVITFDESIITLDEKYIPSNYVNTNAQTFTDEQKQQVRTNIGAVGENDILQADWNQDDETAKDFVKNRTHYEEKYTCGSATVENGVLKWDGNTDGLESIPDNFWLTSMMGKTYYRVYTEIPEWLTVESVGTITNVNNVTGGCVFEVCFDANPDILMSKDYNNPEGFVDFADFSLIVVLKDNSTFSLEGLEDCVIPKKGIYWHEYNDENPDYKMASLTIDEHSFEEGVVMQLDEKYIPDSIARVEDVTQMIEDALGVLADGSY